MDIKSIKGKFAQIEVIENGFLLKHNYPYFKALTYFKTLNEVLLFLKEKVFNADTKVETEDKGFEPRIT